MTLDSTAPDARDRALIRHDALDDTLVVEAAAGTGKTTELVEAIDAAFASCPPEEKRP